MDKTMTIAQAVEALKEAIGFGETPQERMAKAVHSGLGPKEFFQRELFALTDKVLVVIAGLEAQPKDMDWHLEPDEMEP